MKLKLFLIKTSFKNLVWIKQTWKRLAKDVFILHALAIMKAIVNGLPACWPHKIILAIEADLRTCYILLLIRRYVGGNSTSSHVMEPITHDTWIYISLMIMRRFE